MQKATDSQQSYAHLYNQLGLHPTSNTAQDDYHVREEEDEAAVHEQLSINIRTDSRDPAQLELPNPTPVSSSQQLGDTRRQAELYELPEDSVGPDGLPLPAMNHLLLQQSNDESAVLHEESTEQAHMSKEQLENQLSGTPSMFDQEQSSLAATQNQETLKGQIEQLQTQIKGMQDR